MGFFTSFIEALSSGAQSFDSFARAKTPIFKENTKVDNFLLGGQSNMRSAADRSADMQNAMNAMADMRDPGGERTDPDTGRSVRETRGYETKSDSENNRTAGGTQKTMMTTSSTPAAATKTEPKPPAAPKTVAEDPTSSGDLEDEAIGTKKKGRSSTILTSAQGLLTEAPTRGARRLKGLIT